MLGSQRDALVLVLNSRLAVPFLTLYLWSDITILVLNSWLASPFFHAAFAMGRSGSGGYVLAGVSIFPPSIPSMRSFLIGLLRLSVTKLSGLLCGHSRSAKTRGLARLACLTASCPWFPRTGTLSTSLVACLFIAFCFFSFWARRRRLPFPDAFSPRC